MKTTIPVREAMTNKVVTIAPDKTVADVAKLMLKHSVGGIVVKDNDQPVGMVTERDFIKLIADNATPKELTVKEVMSSPLITIAPNASLIDAAQMMSKYKLRKIPVKEKDQLIGIITATDIVKIAPSEIELLLELTRIKADDAGSPGQIGEGECENCSNYSDELGPVGGQMLCSECQ